MKLVLKLSTRFIIILLAVFLGISFLIGYIAMNPERTIIYEKPSVFDLAYENISFYSKDDILLKGWWIPSQSDKLLTRSEKTVIFAHGYGYNRIGEPNKALQLANKLTDEGYNVLLFDFRNSGESASAPTTIGKDEQLDLLAAISYAKKEKSSEKIALFGWSMGAATSILTAASSKEVVSVIADSPFSSLDGYLSDQFDYWTGIPNVFSQAVIKVNELLTPLETKEVDPFKAIDKLDKELLLIHGKEDEAISYKESLKLYKKSKKAKIWVPEKGGHIRTYDSQPNEYEEMVVSFLDNTM